MLFRILFLLIMPLYVSYGQTLVNGFNKSISGSEIDYHSPHPYVKRALISRATDGNMAINWQTDFIPETSSGDLVFVWLSGLGCNLGEQPFTLYLNNDSLLTFYSWDKDNWSVSGVNNSQLTFNGIMVDKSGDRFGIMELKIDRGNIKPKSQINLTIKGHKMGSKAWVMVYKYPLKNELLVKPIPALAKINGKLKQPVQITFVFLDKLSPVSIKYLTGTIDTIASYGINNYEIFLPQTNDVKTEEIKIFFQDKTLAYTYVRTPVKHFEIFLVQHSHTDIGYTRPQQEILAEHLRYIDLALDYCDLTDNYPDEAKFRWTCEASYPVKEYLQSRSHEYINKLKKRVKEGRIEITALPFNFGEILDENMLIASLQPLKTIISSGFSVSTAMQNDVNGIAWAYVDYLSKLGIKYVSMGMHPHRALRPFNYPTPFYWETFSGNKLLAFRADHYMSANFISNPSGDVKYIEDELFKYVENLLNSGYPFNEIEMQFSGYHTDNSPPSIKACEIVKQWNDKYESPRLRLATISQFLNIIEKKYSKELKVYKKAWLDWWTDGFGSAPRETAVALKTQKQLLATQGILSLARLNKINIPQVLLNDLHDIQEQLLFYGEHTFGAAESISEPFSKNSIEQWLTKSSFSWQAQWKTYLLKQKSLSLFLPYLEKSKDNCKIYIFNTSNHKRSAYVDVFVDKQFIPLSKSFSLIDENGKEIKAEIIKQIAEGLYIKIFAEDVLPMNWKCYNLLLKENTIKSNLSSEKSNILENEYYYIEIDKNTGQIKHLIDKEYNLELVDDKAFGGFGMLVKEFLSDRHNMELYKKGEAKQSSLSIVSLEPLSENSFWKSIKINGYTVDSELVVIDIRLLKNVKRIDLVYQIQKKRILEPEALYISFPYKLQEGKIYFNLHGSQLLASVDQLEGTSNDWNTVHNYVSVRNKNYQIILSSPDCPLMQFGNINTGRYNPLAKLETTHIFAWPYNNYWTTNFKAWEEGELSWQFSFTSSIDTSTTYAELFGENIQLPMIGFIVPPSNSDKKGILHDNKFSFLDISNIVVSMICPLEENNDIHVVLRETGGKKVSIKIPKNYYVYSSDVLGRIKKRIFTIDLNPYESNFIVIKN
ncbi:glycoside hydrolase family 38 C-terminal domain-containing protein [Ignavibacteria bacterium 4148-Me]|uniref:glycoside hydrolase family 38 N-terminal domain-containing protein n=1 Tax=Rosettibacter primus TaxID=3111523 RepID=UPI00336BE384